MLKIYKGIFFNAFTLNPICEPICSIKGDLTVSGSISDKDRHPSTSPTTNIMTNSVIT